MDYLLDKKSSSQQLSAAPAPSSSQALEKSPSTSYIQQLSAAPAPSSSQPGKDSLFAQLGWNFRNGFGLPRANSTQSLTQSTMTTPQGSPGQQQNQPTQPQTLQTTSFPGQMGSPGQQQNQPTQPQTLEATSFPGQMGSPGQQQNQFSQPLLVSYPPQVSPLDSEYRIKYKQQKQLTQQLAQQQAQQQAQQLAQQQAQQLAQQLAQYQAQLQTQLQTEFNKQNKKQLKQEEKLKQQQKIEAIEAQLLKLKEAQVQAPVTTASPGITPSPLSPPNTATLSNEVTLQQPPQQQQVQPIGEKQPVETSQQQQVEEQPKPSILFISRCKLMIMKSFLPFYKDYYFALGQRFMCYDNNQSKAEQVALQTSGDYDNDDKVIDVINDKVEITLMLPGTKNPGTGTIYQNAVLLKYTKRGAKIEQLFEFDPSPGLPQPLKLKALVTQIQTSHAAKVQSEGAKSSMKQRLTKYLSELTEISRLLEMLTKTAKDTGEDSIVGLIDSESFKDLKESINTNKINLEKLISNSDNSTTEDDVILAGAQVNSIIEYANVYMKNIITTVNALDTNDKKTGLLIQVAKEILTKISLVLKSAAEARVAAAESRSVQSVSTTPSAPATPTPGSAVGPAAAESRSVQSVSTTPSAAAVGPAAAADFNPKKMKEILMKTLRDMEHYEDVLSNLKELYESNENSKTIFSNIEPIFKKIEKNKTTLKGLISTLKDNYVLAPPTEDEVINAKKAIEAANAILSRAKILKDMIIEEGGKICANNDDTYECKIFKSIKQSDEQWMEINADANSTTNNMDAVVKEAEAVFNSVKQLVSYIESIQSFYHDSSSGSSSSSVDDTKLDEVLTKYKQLKQYVVDIDTCHKDVLEIQRTVNAFDQSEFFSVSKNMDKVTVLRTETYVDAAKFTAKLSELMSKSAFSILEKALEKCRKLTKTVEKNTDETTSTSSRITIIDKEVFDSEKAFDILIQECKTLFGLFKQLTTGNNAELWKSNEDMTLYINQASSMMGSIKDKAKGKEVSDVFKEVGKSIKTATDEKEKFEKKKSEVIFLETIIDEFIENTKKQYIIIESFDTGNSTFKKEYDELIKKLKDAQAAAIDAFNKYKTLAATADAADAPAADTVTSPAPVVKAAIAEAKTKADKAYGDFFTVYVQVQSLFSDAKLKLETIIKDAVFDFITKDAETKLTEIQNFKSNEYSTNENLKTDLENKRKDVYKISDIESINTEYSKLETKHQDISELKSKTETLVANFTEKSDNVFQAIEENTRNLTDDKTKILNGLQGEVIGIVGNDSGSQSQDKTLHGIQEEAQTVFNELEGFKKGIVTMYTELERNNTAEFQNEKQNLKSKRDGAENLFKQAGKIKGDIDRMVAKVTSKKQEIDSMIEKYKEIYQKYTTAPPIDTNDNIELISSKISKLDNLISEITGIKSSLNFLSILPTTDQSKLRSYASTVIGSLNDKLKQMKRQHKQLVSAAAAQAAAEAAVPADVSASAAQAAAEAPVPAAPADAANAPAAAADDATARADKYIEKLDSNETDDDRKDVIKRAMLNKNFDFKNYAVGENGNITFKEFRIMGFLPKDLKPQSNATVVSEMKDAGFTAGQLKDAEYDLDTLKAASFSAAELKEAGFSAAELKAEGFTARQLKHADFSDQELLDVKFDQTDIDDADAADAADETAASDYVAKISDNDADAQRKQYIKNTLIRIHFDTKKMKNEGITAKEAITMGFVLDKDDSYSISELKDAGHELESLIFAGFTATQLKAEGFSASDLKAAGFSAAQLKEALFTAADLKDAGFDLAQLKEANFKISDILKAGFTTDELKAENLGVKELWATEGITA